jgi:hypothetical protein
MKQFTLETPTHFHLLGCGDDVEVRDGGTIDVGALDSLEGGRMAVEAGMVLDLIERDARDGLAEIGIEVLASVSIAGLNWLPDFPPDTARRPPDRYPAWDHPEGWRRPSGGHGRGECSWDAGCWVPCSSWPPR